MGTRSLIVALCLAASLGARVEAGEHLLFRSVVHLRYENHYRIFLSLQLLENRGAWDAFTVRRTVETIDPDRDCVLSQNESSITLAFGELVALGEKGFPLLALPGTTFNVLYLKAHRSSKP